MHLDLQFLSETLPSSSARDFSRDHNVIANGTVSDSYIIPQKPSACNKPGLGRAEFAEPRADDWGKNILHGTPAVGSHSACDGMPVSSRCQASCALGMSMIPLSHSSGSKGYSNGSR